MEGFWEDFEGQVGGRIASKIKENLMPAAEAEALELDFDDLEWRLARSCPRIEQASPIDWRSTESRSSRLRTRSNEHAQNMQNAT